MVAKVRHTRGSKGMSVCVGGGSGLASSTHLEKGIVGLEVMGWEGLVGGGGSSSGFSSQ